MGNIHLACFLQHSPNANNPTTWKYPRTRVGFEWNRPEIYIEMAKIAERGKFDALFFADTLGVNATYGGTIESNLRHAVLGPLHDSLTLVALLAGHTERLGLTATMSASYYPPFLLARLTATVDHLSRGRLGWNVVTSPSVEEAQNFGLDGLYSRDERYDRADEFLELCYQLWDSWEPDAVLEDKENGIFTDPSKVHHVNFEGKYFKCRGPLNVSRSPQGRPILFQAGASHRGKDFAAKHAEVIFVQKNNINDMKRFYDDVKSRMIKFGRNPDDCKILFSIMPIVGETEEIALIKQQQLLKYATAEAGLTWASSSMGVDLSQYDLDKPLPGNTKVDGVQGKMDQFYGEDKPTLREFGIQQAAGVTLPLVGSGEQVAEKMEEIFKEVGGDGFMFVPSYVPSSLTEFVEMVIPELQRKGLYRKEYTGTTLREHLFAT